jgi:transcriptional regulator with XRE-family HTH domain
VVKLTKKTVAVDGQKLKKARGSRTIPSVAEALGVTRQHLWQIENGRSQPSVEVLTKLCWLYDVPLTGVTANGNQASSAAKANFGS